MSPPAIQAPCSAARPASSTAAALASAVVPPATPTDTAIATAAAPARPSPVLWVTREASMTASSRDAGSGPKAMPTGAMRIAAPFVVPRRPARSGWTPLWIAAIAAFVEGPSRSSDPLASMTASQSASARANRCGSIRPAPSISRSATIRACSVSSVMDPAAMLGAIGCSAVEASSASTCPYSSWMRRRGIDWVGMPSASPSARPVRLARARSRRSVEGVMRDLRT